MGNQKYKKVKDNSLYYNDETVSGGLGDQAIANRDYGYGGNYIGNETPAGLARMTRQKIKKFLKDFGGSTIASGSFTPTFGGNGKLISRINNFVRRRSARERKSTIL